MGRAAGAWWHFGGWASGLRNEILEMWWLKQTDPDTSKTVLALSHSSSIFLQKTWWKHCLLSGPFPLSGITHISSSPDNYCHLKERASLVAQWLRIRLPMQGTRVRALVQEEPTCRRATKPGRRNYWACALESASHNYSSLHSRAHALQQEKPPQWEARTPQQRVAPARHS